MGKRVYIETSVISYLVARPSRNILAVAWQQVTQEWWDNQRERFELFTSELVMVRLARAIPTRHGRAKNSKASPISK